MLAAGLAHELQHSRDLDLVAMGLMPPDCTELEVRAFEAQAKVARAFWPDELPDGTDWEKGLAMIVRAYEAGGTNGLRAMVGSVEGYHSERCAP